MLIVWPFNRVLDHHAQFSFLLLFSPKTDSTQHTITTPSVVRPTADGCHDVESQESTLSEHPSSMWNHGKLKSSIASIYSSVKQ